MKKSKTTRRALFSSVMALLLCCSMLVGTTFAWFTDTVTSTGNIIKSGTLDVEMYWADGTKAVPADDSSDWTDASRGAIFNYDRWEPGYTEVRHIMIKNVGTLDLKYQLGIKAAGEVSELTDVIDVYFADPAVQVADRADLSTADGVKKLDNLTRILAGMPSNTAGDLEDGQAVIVTLALKMQESAGNEYQNLSVGSEFAVQLLATQMENELDSFGSDYDAGADNNDYVTVTVANEEELVAALAAAKSGDVIGISGNVTWTTGAGIGSTPFVTEATNITLKGIGTDATFTAIGSGVGEVGIDGGTVIFKDLKIVDESVSYAENSWEYGYLEFRGNTVFENCDVVNAIMMEGDSAKFVDCSFNSYDDNQYAVWVINGSASFENCTFTGARGLKIHEDYGSEVASVSVNNSAFKSLTKKPGVAIGDVNADTAISLTNNLFAGTQAGDQGNYKYETDTDVTTFKFVDENNSVIENAANNSNELKDALANNAKVLLNEGEYTLTSLANYEGVTIIGGEGVVIGGADAATGFSSNFGKDTTIKNVTFSGTTNGVRYSYAKGGNTTFEDCTFAGDSTYGFHIDESNGATFTFNNCTFIGFNAFAGDLEKVIFNDCTFLSNGNYGHTNIWSVGEFNNCTWGDKTSVSPAGGGKLYFDDVEESYHHEFVGSADSLFAFAKSVNEGNDSWSGQKVLLVADIDLDNAVWTPIGQTGATQFKGTFDGQDHTISNLNIDSSAQTGANYSSGLFGWVEGDQTIQNVKVDGAAVTGNHNVAVIVGYTYSAKISNCHVTNANIVCKHANDDACGDKCGLIAGYAGDESRISNCSASNSTVTAGRDAGQLVGAGYNVSMNNGSADNVTVTATGECTGANINNALIGRVLG